MGIYGPFVSVLGAVVPVAALDAAADRVYVENRSIYDLLIAFGDTAPPAVTAVAGGPWYALVPPGGKGVAIPRDRVGGASWNGKLYALAVNPIGAAASAATNTIQATSTQFYVQTLAPGEVAPADYTIPQFMNASNQQRIVTVPMAWQQPAQGIVLGSFPANLASFQLTAQQIAFKTCSFYIGFASFAPETGTGSMDMVLGARFLNAGGVELSRFIFARGGVEANDANKTTSPWYFAPANPACYLAAGSMPVGAVFIAPFVDYLAGAFLNLNYTILSALDTVNYFCPGSYGFTFGNTGSVW